MKKLISVLVCTVLLGLCACSPAAAETPEIAPAPDFAPLTDIQPGREDVYLIVKNLESSYWKVIIAGAKQAGEDLGCNVYYSGTYSETDWTGHERLLDDCIARGADAVLLSPDDSVALAPKVSEVYQAGIPMVLIDTTANTDHYDVCFMTDNLLAGQNAAAEMLSQLYAMGHGEDEDVRVAIMVGSVASQTINERLAGFYQFWTQNAPPRWQIITDIRSYDGNAGLAEEIADDILTDYPEVDGVYGTNNGPTAGFAKIIKQNSRTDLAIVGFDYSDDIAELIALPEYHASTMLQRQFDMSYRGVEAALDLIAGESSESKFIDTGVVTVNADTLSSPDVQEVLSHN